MLVLAKSSAEGNELHVVTFCIAVVTEYDTLLSKYNELYEEYESTRSQLQELQSGNVDLANISYY